MKIEETVAKYLSGRSLVERKELIDSRILQKSIKLILSDLDENEKKLAKWIISKLEQSFPDDDVTIEDIKKMVQDPRIKSVTSKVKGLDNFILHIFQ